MGRHSRSVRIAAAGLLLAASLALLDSSFNDNAFDFSAEEEEAQLAAAVHRLAQDTFGSYYYGDDDLLWIAEEYLRAPLPDEWELVLGPAVGDLGQFGQQAELSPFSFRHRHTGEHTPRSPLHDHYQRIFIALKTEELLDGHHVAQPPPPQQQRQQQQQQDAAEQQQHHQHHHHHHHHHQQGLPRPDTAEQLLRDAVDSAGRVGRMGPGGSALAALSSLSAADLEQRLRSSGVDLALVKAAHERTARGLRAEQVYLKVRARVTGRKQDDTLRSVVASIRMREASLDFQLSRGSAVTAMAANSTPGVVGQRLWSEGNYGYGLVTFPAWEAIFVRPGIARDLVKPLVVAAAAAAAAEAAAAAVAAAEARGTRYPYTPPPPSNTASDRASFVVLGSNLGTEAFFAALSLGVRVEGHEILDSLHNTATRLQHEWSVPQSGPASVHLVRGDALDADLSSARVLWIDNQVWDDRLVNNMFRKAAAELPQGALVVDFASASRPSISRNTASATVQALPLVGCGALESSWSASRTPVAFRARVPRGDGDGDGVPDQHRHDATGGGHRWLWHCCASDIASGLASHVTHLRRIARDDTCRSGTGGTEACHDGSVSGSAAAEDSDNSGISVDASTIAQTFLSRNDNDEPTSWKLHTTIRSSPFALAAALIVSSEFMRFRLALRPAVTDFITSAVEQAIAVASQQDRVSTEHEHHQHGHRSFLMLEHIVPHESHTLLSTGLTLDDLMPVGAASPHASLSATRTSSSRMDPALQYVHLGVGGKRRRTEEAGAAAGTDPAAEEGGASLYRRILLQLEKSINARTRNGLEKSVVDGLCSNASVSSSFAPQGLECTGLGFPLEEVRGKTFEEATRAARTKPTGPTEPLPAILTLAISYLPLTRDRWHPLLRSAYDILAKAREMGIWRGGAARRRGRHGGGDVSGGGGGHSGEEGGEGDEGDEGDEGGEDGEGTARLEALVQLHLFATKGGDGGGGGTPRPGSKPVEGTRVWIVDESRVAEEGENPPGGSSPNSRRRRPYTVLRVHSVAELVAAARASPPYDDDSNVRLCEVPGPLQCSFRATYATPGVQRLLDNYLRLGMLSDSSNPESPLPTSPGNTGARTHTRRTLSYVFGSCAALGAGHTSTGTRKAKGDVGGSEEVVISMGWL